MSPLSPPVLRSKNTILSHFKERDLRAFTAESQVVRLADRRVLAVPGQPAQHVYFPLDSAVSGLSVLGDGHSVEAITVGAEGLVGLPVLYGYGWALRWEVVIPGLALRVPECVVRQHLAGTGEFVAACRIYAGIVVQDIVETLACNAIHSLGARYARWLLLLQDRCAEEVLPVTQERASELLGVSRQSVSSVAAAFQREGLIDQTRGRMRVLNREGIEEQSCSCYRNLNGRLKLPVRGAPDTAEAATL